MDEQNSVEPNSAERHIERAIANRRIKGFGIITTLVTILVSCGSDVVCGWWHWYWVMPIMIACFGIWMWHLIHSHMKEFKGEYEEIQTLRAKELSDQKKREEDEQEKKKEEAAAKSEPEEPKKQEEEPKSS